MSSELLEQQAEEREALQAIYDGDAQFIQVNETTFQYKYGEEDSYKSFLVEVKWTEKYPAELPVINLDTFYNRNLAPVVKEKILNALLQEGENWLESAMTYSLFEMVRDKLEELIADQPECGSGAQALETESVGISAIKISDDTGPTKKKESKKEHLTKAQKRRQWEHTDHKGERPRGWDWVDIIRHLSQTGSKEDNVSGSASLPLQPLNT